MLRRFLKLQGIEVRHVMNITDVDDKIIRNAAAAGISISEYTPRFEKAFFRGPGRAARGAAGSDLRAPRNIFRRWWR